MTFIELLAPAKDLQTGIEAIKHGADAVYIGAPKFGARAAAGNSVEDIRQLVDFARPYGVKVYVTLNTLLREDEMEEAQQLAEELCEAGVDALIVQDLSLLNEKGKILLPFERSDQGRAKREKLKVHASTQMDNQTAEKVAWLRDLGFEQVVLARELTLDEIREIHERVPDVKLEVFVHGAICVCYNGRCFASEHCFGRSANRGECAQFCRLPFDLEDEEGNILQHQKHLLSLRDMNRSDDLEALLDAGVSSLKIEGRLKDAAYVKNVVAYYRQRLDEIFRRRTEYQRSSLGHETISFTPNPMKSFNRLFTDYFLHGRTTDMANIHTPKSMGEPVGFAEIKNEKLKIKNDENSPFPIHNGDGLCYINKEGELEGFRVNRVEADKIYLANGKSLPITGEGWREGLTLYRNHDQQFNQLLSKPTATRKVGVRWLLKETGEGLFLLRLTREDGASVEQTFPYPREVARTPQRESIVQQLSRLGDTPYEATAVDIDLTDNWFIPRSVLAEWRRILTSDEFQVTSDEFKVTSDEKEIDQDMIERQRKPDEPGLLMICRYCIRHELGLCPKRQKAKSEGQRGLFLRLGDGRRFRLAFDCRKCQMKVYADKD
ncbi:MAG: U32 family peptidase [Bacteroidaceae bacterium]|nr:U32 family peptidase [Bacteroidaceae bacterium]